MTMPHVGLYHLVVRIDGRPERLTRYATSWEAVQIIASKQSQRTQPYLEVEPVGMIEEYIP